MSDHAVRQLPYQGLRVVEFSHRVMGPTCAMVLADLGAQVIKVEAVGQGRHGDAWQRRTGLARTPYSPQAPLRNRR